MTVGYIRISTADQNPARQEEAFKKHGVESLRRDDLRQGPESSEVEGTIGFRAGRRHGDCRVLFPLGQVYEGSSPHHRQASGEKK